MLTLWFIALLAAPAFGRSAIKIIGGSPATTGQFPYQGSLRLNGNHYCGCVLVATRYCISAAHCTVNSPSSYDVQLGITIRSQPQNGQTIAVSTFFNHPNYGSGPGSFPNDISVVLLASAANLANPLISTIPMANSNDNDEGSRGTISGWGYTTPGGTNPVLPDHLQYVTVDVHTRATCNSYWGASINDGHICIGNIGSAASCNGDSGGPLAVGGRVVGITSWGVQGCWTQYPAVYTKVAYFRTWLDGIIS